MTTDRSLAAKNNTTSPSPTRWQTFWRRYSPSGELPISTAASIGLHAFVVLLFALGLTSLANRNQRSPGVDVVSIIDGDGEGAAAGFGLDGKPSGDASGSGGDAGQLMETTESSLDVPQPTQAAEKLNTDIASDTPEEIDLAPSEAPASGSDIASRAESVIDKIKKRQARTLGGGGGGAGKGTGGDGTGGGGEGGGGGTAPTGRAGRQARWILQFRMRNAADYVAQMKGLGASIAFPTDGGKLLHFDLATDPPAQTKRNIDDISQICWYEQSSSSAQSVARFLRAPPSSIMMLYLPEDLEGRMTKLEKAYRGLAEEQIKSTRFEVVRTGGGFDVTVESQESR
jgi:hypothetical protein